MYPAGTHSRGLARITSRWQSVPTIAHFLWVIGSFIRPEPLSRAVFSAHWLSTWGTVSVFPFILKELQACKTVTRILYWTLVYLSPGFTSEWLIFCLSVKIYTHTHTHTHTCSLSLSHQGAPVNDYSIAQVFGRTPIHRMVWRPQDSFCNPAKFSWKQ